MDSAFLGCTWHNGHGTEIPVAREGTPGTVGVGSGRCLLPLVSGASFGSIDGFLIGHNILNFVYNPTHVFPVPRSSIPA